MVKYDEASMGSKLMRLFLLLLTDGRRHYQADLAEMMNCSRQTVIRLIEEIQAVIGDSLLLGRDKHSRWYQLRARTGLQLGLDRDELRVMALFRDFAEDMLPAERLRAVDQTIMTTAIHSLSASGADQDDYAFDPQGSIDYTRHLAHIEALVQAKEQHQACILTQRTDSGELVPYRVAVSTFAVKNNLLYVLGDSLAEDFTCIESRIALPVHRIAQVEGTPHHVLAREPKQEKEQELRRFRIRFAPGHAAAYVGERIWAKNQTIKHCPDGSLLLSLVTRDEQKVLDWVASFGDQAELVPPPSSPADGKTPA